MSAFFTPISSPNPQARRTPTAPIEPRPDPPPPPPKRHRGTGKWEAHLWDPTVRRKKRTQGGRRAWGKQVYLGAYNTEVEAARAYDMAAIVFFGSAAKPNFSLEEAYGAELASLSKMGKEDVVNMLRRQCRSFSRGESQYRGVTRHRASDLWEARIGNMFGKNYVYLGLFESEQAAAMAYDFAALYRGGPSSLTNFDPRSYLQGSTGRTTAAAAAAAATGVPNLPTAVTTM
ncbi:pathogenesis-related genes transcriptional activator [Volvox carteri f. nagariensis]|uniref:Pathogenesis-related genes transcriptional activator n=1 Tax=Volvox carteri f. nagariensis TaxID=3068 RepID=D8UFK5_VOLCA|nr:pathogenesis-related genes transcriptional activator [Volvox carteri f. nagariensis]EFJ41520.1 pathogenesis-related genes transcriptional activator [Volvox carteri f. nagariensis]|eukprot:XP_002957465.1 pathogenesis-related genes transcriptional activator [Volvox carteri f. nagariensis]